MRYLRRVAPVVPLLLLIGLATGGIASALQADSEEPDFGPLIEDYTSNGTTDIAGYLAADARYAQAPAVPFDETIELRVFGCSEGDPITIEVVPRVLRSDEEAAQGSLADDQKLLTEPEVLVEQGEALAEPGTYELTIPATTPQGFTRLRVTCTAAEGEPGVWDTVLQVVDGEEFAAAQEALDEAEREELVTTLDGGSAPESLAVSPAT